MSRANDWENATIEDIELAVSGSITSGALTRTCAKKGVLGRLLYALERYAYINEANPLVSLLIYNLHREIDGKPPLDSLDDLEIQIFNIAVPRDEDGGANNELYIIENGKVVRAAAIGIKDDHFSRRLKELIADMARE